MRRNAPYAQAKGNIGGVPTNKQKGMQRLTRALKSAYGRQNHHALPGPACAVSGRWKALANGVHTGGSVRGPSGNRLHAARGTLGASTSGLHPAAIWRRGVPPAGKLLTALLGERLRRSQLAALAPS
jgi:hypothetical protein